MIRSADQKREDELKQYHDQMTGTNQCAERFEPNTVSKGRASACTMENQPETPEVNAILARQMM